MSITRSPLPVDARRREPNAFGWMPRGTTRGDRASAPLVPLRHKLVTNDEQNGFPKDLRYGVDAVWPRWPMSPRGAKV
jgi:hypothetical protein